MAQPCDAIVEPGRSLINSDQASSPRSVVHACIDTVFGTNAQVTGSPRTARLHKSFANLFSATADVFGALRDYTGGSSDAAERSDEVGRSPNVWKDVGASTTGGISDADVGANEYGNYVYIIFTCDDYGFSPRSSNFAIDYRAF